ncbi:MAG: glycosyltransferase, partial [Candidatus Aminicenantes bacterium]|nr:glycosyltransferase [Candidatus Aminicenantes bacterium]
MEFKTAKGVVFTGFATGELKEELLSNALCFVQPSTIEGMPLSILEAMGYARMILASDIQENLDVLAGHGSTFKSRDVDDLAKKLSEILSRDSSINKAEGEKLNKFGLENYDWDEITDKVEG